MKTKLLQTLLLLFGTTTVYGQVNLSDMAADSSDSLQKSKIRYFSPGKGGKDRVCNFFPRIRRQYCITPEDGINLTDNATARIS